MATEIELKYLLCETNNTNSKADITTEITNILLSEQLSFSQQQKQLANYYLDTPNLELRHLDMGLRVRGIKTPEAPLQFEQTIKTAGQVVGGLHKRPEYNVDISSKHVDLSLFPENIWRDSGGDVDKLQQDIQSLFETHFTRTTWLIELAGSVIELAFDEGSVSCEGYDKTLPIYEIELELVSGEQQALFSLAKILLATLAMRPGQLSKAARGYTLAAQFNASKDNISKENNLKLTKKAINENIDTTPVELQLEVIPMRGVTSISQAFQHGVSHSLTSLQRNVECYISEPKVSTLIKIAELLALLRQGFWLFEQELSVDYIEIRKELSYFIRVINWADNAEHLQELMSKSGGYRKKIAHSDELITKLQLEKSRYPDTAQIIALFYSERFNLLQLSLLNILLNNESLVSLHTSNDSSLLNFAQQKLTYSLQTIKTEMSLVPIEPTTEACQSYMSLHGILIRSLLAGSWFSTLFDGEVSREKMQSYRRAWLDIKQGISELQTLYILKQQLAVLSHPEEKLEKWLDSKIENLLLALTHSRDNAESIKPYWQF
ncbi:inorganic triphosphatase [Colwellia asteriadis]|uniref:Inorganic triphosphatase n=1 Tax=Colwellia asteriadis TaxID=517723 RepID=A0ABP3WD40_9GAMM